MFMKTAIVPIIKNETEDCSFSQLIKTIVCQSRWLQQNHFLKLSLLIILEDYLVT